MAAFLEIFRCSGVDQRHSPPGMVVPFGGSNIVALIDPQRKLKVDPNPHALEIKEFDGAEIVKRTIEFNNSLYQPGIDPQYKEAMLPGLFYGDARFYEIKGRIKPIGFPGIEVKARSGKNIEARLQVVVLEQMKIKVGIRNVMVPDVNGNPVSHPKHAANETNEILAMNGVWNKQANIYFQLVPSQWLVIDDTQPAFKQELAKAYGMKMKDTSLATFSKRVNGMKLRDIFAKHKVPGAHLTFFVVDQVLLADETAANGVCIASHEIAFISSTHGPTTFAHEAGHFIGGHMDGKCKAWSAMGHTLERDPKTGKPDDKEDIRMLMRWGGAGWMIPFDLVRQFRGFSDRHPVH